MIYAMAAMVLLTTIVGFVAIKRRIKSVKDGSLDIHYFKLMNGHKVPNSVEQSTRNFNNLFEVPVLFYVVCTLYVSLSIESSIAIVFAWLFVVFRYGHSYIHLTYNKLLHRMIIYWCAIVAVLALWINLLIII